ncbi:MAG: hypothetical protein ABIN89_27805, partial [Chitinophagaceae bacterium]
MVTAATGIISTIAGGGQGFSGDGGAATAAQFNHPTGLARDGNGNLYVADFLNSRIRKITAATGIISTIAGTGTAGYSGNGGISTTATLNGPWDVVLDASENIYIAELYNHVIRKIAAGTGIISTLAGTGIAGFSGDGGNATSAQLFNPYSLVFDGSGNFYIADTYNSRIRKVTAGTGIISTIAGTVTPGFSGDGGPAVAAQLNTPTGISLDRSGNLLVPEFSNS